MKTLNLTDAEHTIIKQSLETFNDMQLDMALDNIESVNLFPRGEQITTITSTQANTLRNELYDAITRQANIRSVLIKLGIQVNNAGYTV